MKILKQREGVSLIIAVIFVSALMLASAGLAEVFIQSARERADSNHSDMSNYLAESVLEFARYEASEKGIGANITSKDFSD